MSDIFDVFYKLPIAYEDRREGGQGWYKLSWRPIWKHTFSLHGETILRRPRVPTLGIRGYRCDARGWGRSYKHLAIEIGLLFVTIHFWVRWKFVVIGEGPMDEEPRRPLDLEQRNRARVRL